MSVTDDTVTRATPLRGGRVELVSLTKSYGTQLVLKGIDLTIEAGEFFSLLGPSGGGKTTLLRMIAGFEFPTEGSVQIRGKEVGLEPPNRRPVNTVFQSYALFPHMTVEENVGFGLLMKKVAGAAIAERVSRALDQVQLGHRSGARPAQLSGGQQQRVALARALVNEPEVLLLDEPLGALDLKLRQAMQVELKELQERVGITFVYVTHDQEEALTMSDRIGVINEGRLLQVGRPQEIYEHPTSRFVADFIGDINLIPAVVGQGDTLELPGGHQVRGSTGASPGEAVTIAIRPERFELYDLDEAMPDGLNQIKGTVVRRMYHGDVFFYNVETAAGVINAKEENRPGVELYELGESTIVTWDPRAASVVSD